MTDQSMQRVRVFDTTLRDGEQAPGGAMHLKQKLAIAEQLEILGVDVIEAGFPAASREDAEAVAAIARQCRNTVVCAFARATPADIAAGLEAVRLARAPRINIVLPISDLHLDRILGISRDVALEIVQRSITLARNSCPEVEFIAADMSRADPGFMCAVSQTAIEAGANFLTLADTVGYATPRDIATYLDALRHGVPLLERAVLGIHCHNDLGMATINTLQAIESGVRQVHCTVNGIGERAGNAALEEVVMALAIRPDRYPYTVGLDIGRLWPVSHQIAEIAGFSIAPNKAVIGENAYAHGSGMHQDGILKAANTYEIIDSSRIGAPGRRLPITRLSGRRGLASRMAELGYSLSEMQLDQAFICVKTYTLDEKIVSDDELRRIAEKIQSNC